MRREVEFNMGARNEWWGHDMIGEVAVVCSGNLTKGVITYE